VSVFLEKENGRKRDEKEKFQLSENDLEKMILKSLRVVLLFNNMKSSLGLLSYYSIVYFFFLKY